MNYGFIGAGNMGSAIMQGLLKKKTKHKIYAYDLEKKKVEALGKKVEYVSLENIVEKSDVIVLAVKPQMMDDVLKEINS
ncbi:MAG: NAD(P)-binding domain-containing protein, partial [Solobacterium sp.]|nr:NAD(P)-binding domain-containing protein [Solobacterium sp.]